MFRYTMQTQYIHASSRAKALRFKLLTETQLERLLSAKDTEEVRKVLQDTYLAPYLAKGDDVSIQNALDQSVLDAKKTIESIAPQKEIFEILWLKYDFANLKTIVKGRRLGLNTEQLRERCLATGKYSIDTIIKAYDEGKLGNLNIFFVEAVEKANAAKVVYKIDIVMNIYYFRAMRQVALKYSDRFIREYSALLIDFFNLESALRLMRLDAMEQKEIFIYGGMFSRKDIETKKQIFDSYKRLGGEKLWADAISAYDDHGDFSLLEKTAEEYTLEFLKVQSTGLLSPAPLFAYFSAIKNNAQTIRAIVVAKQSGMPEKEIRRILRRLYS